MQRYILFILFISLIYPRSADWDADTVHTSLLSYKVELFSDGYVIPWGMSFLPDGDLLVSDISGKIYRVNRNGGKKAMISGVPKVFYKGQGGMLDVEVHPEFEKNNLVYFSFSDLNGKSSFTSIARAELKANSLVGLKPTTGSLSRTGVVPISASLDTAGPMTRSIADVVVLFNSMAGYDQDDLAMPLISDDMQLIYRETSLAGKRLGVIDRYADNAFYNNALSVLSANNAELIDLSFNPSRQPQFTEFLGAEMVRDLALYLSKSAAERVEILSITELQAFNNVELEVRAPYGQGLIDMMAELNYNETELEELRVELQAWGREILDRTFIESNLDVLVGVNNHQAGIAALANYPALTIPMGYEKNGRPIGLTLIAPPFQEQLLIDVGVQFETLTQARKIPSKYQ